MAPELKRELIDDKKMEIDRILGTKPNKKTKTKRLSNTKYQFKSVQGILKLNTRLIGKYKGKTYKAILRSN